VARLLVVVLVATLLSLVPAAPASHESTGPPTLIELALQTRDLAYDPFSRKIYATVRDSASPELGRIVAIDPVTGAIGRSVVVGTDPEWVVVSNDGRYLYVALDGEGAVRRVRLPGLLADLKIMLGTDPVDGGPLVAGDLAVQPGNSAVLAVSRRDTIFPFQHEGIVIYVDGVKLPDEIPAEPGSNVIEFGSTAAPLVGVKHRLYSYNSETTAFRRLEVGPSGVSTLDVTENLFIDVTDMEFDNGRIYGTEGTTIDAESRTIVGTYPLGSDDKPVEPDSDHGLVYFLTANAELQPFDLETFTPLPPFPVPMEETPMTLISIHDGNLAYSTIAGELVLVHFPTAGGSVPPSVATDPNAAG
jgi:DNA-binding beta-propeller fold protein YncE